MSAIDDLVNQINNEVIRGRLKAEIQRLKKDKKFGLLFEEHLPEISPIYTAEIRENSKVARRGSGLKDIWRVISKKGEFFICEHTSHGEIKEFDKQDLFVVSQFGDPIFPALESVEQIQNGENDAPWHTLIEAENYHALQLLQYIYPEQVDCIYIDPPYNTGARDWKYNNDYVDKNDSWRHSKWLSFMKKRLELAKNLLSPSGVLITTIDDNEFAHLWMILKDLFPRHEHFPITIQHNPGGTQGNRFSVVHEYAIYTVGPEANIYKKPHLEEESYNLRRWGSTSNRFEGATCFYPIYIDKNLQVTGFGEVPVDDFSPKRQKIIKKDGTFEVWPIDKNGIEKKWRYARNTVESVSERLFTVNDGDRIEIKIRREDEVPKTVWTDKLYNADSYGSSLLSKILNGEFDYPKSLYAVRDSIDLVVKDKKNALILDFFAGSGTTMQAVNLLNKRDEGKRQCIMVTNNEVSEKDAKKLKKKGLCQGQKEWEMHGICQSVAWPRTKNTILGVNELGEPLEGTYKIGEVKQLEKNRNIKQLGFSNSKLLQTGVSKKQLVALIEGIPQSKIKTDTKYFLSDDYSASILFDIEQSDEWVSKLNGREHIKDFYIVTGDNKKYKAVKNEIIDLLGPYVELDEKVVPMSEGFDSNVEYFRLMLLNKDKIALGNQFKELLPILWLLAGAKGERPTFNFEDKLPDMIIEKATNFAVLLNEMYFSDFKDKISVAQGIEKIFLITDSDDAFKEMSSRLDSQNIIHLYKDYLSNFIINVKGN